MAKKIMAALMIAALMCVMILPAYAAGTFNSELYYVTWSEGTTSYKRYYQITGFPYTLSYIGASDSYYLYLCFKTNQIILDGSIIVIALTLNDILPNDITVLGVAPSTSGTLPSNSTVYPSAFESLNLNQEIIASTIKQTGNSTTVTVTFRASGFNNMYPIIGYRNVIRLNSNTAITMANCSLYETVEEAAGSGTTPEEMREVLSSWGEEELIPGIGQAVGDKIEQVVPDAILDGMEEHDNQLKTEGNSVIDNVKDQIEQTITPYFENTEQIRDAIHGGATGIFGYAGTDAVITLPAARNPLTGNSLMWNEYQIDLGMYYNRLPAALRQLISALFTLLVSIAVIRELLDTVNTILIHREMLGMPDELLRSWTRRDG